MDEKIEEILDLDSSEDIDNPVKTNGEKYPALRIIAGFYKFLAYGVGLIAIGFFIFGVIRMEQNPDGATIILLGSVVVGSITFITLLAMSEGIMLFVNMANDLYGVKRELADRSD